MDYQVGTHTDILFQLKGHFCIILTEDGETIKSSASFQEFTQLNEGQNIFKISNNSRVRSASFQNSFLKWLKNPKMDTPFLFPLQHDGEDMVILWEKISRSEDKANQFCLLGSPKAASEDINKLFYLVVEHSLNAIFLTTPDGKVLRTNKAASRIFGYSESEMINGGRSLLFEKDDPFLKEMVKERAKKGHVEGETIGIRKNGERFPCEIASAIFEDSQGNLKATVTINDISERKKLETQKSESERRFRALVQEGSDMVALIDQDANYIYASPTVEKVLNYPPHYFENHNAFDFIHPDDREKVQSFFLIAQQQRTSEIPPYRFRHFNGEWRWLETHITNHTSDPLIKAYVANSRDVTIRVQHELKLKRLNQELQERAAKLKESNQALENFAYTASHDLQEPLRMVQSFLELLEKEAGENLTEQATEYLHYAANGAERMKLLIMDLLEYARIGTRELKPEIVDMQALVQDVLFTLKPSIEKEKATIHCGKLPKVNGLMPLLRNLIQNLLTNALKYRGPEDPVISIDYTFTKALYTFSVKDNGIGIPSEQKEEVFKLFKRLHPKQKFPGTGLGLSICQKIVEKHGGRIWVESELYEGSTFYFTIPAV